LMRLFQREAVQLPRVRVFRFRFPYFFHAIPRASNKKIELRAGAFGPPREL
jgi:hypothetical protein